MPVPQYGRTGFIGGAPSGGNPFESTLDAFITNFDSFGDKLTKEGEQNQESAAAAADSRDRGQDQEQGPSQGRGLGSPGRGRGRRPHSGPSSDAPGDVQRLAAAGEDKEDKHMQDAPSQRPGRYEADGRAQHDRYQTYGGPPSDDAYYLSPDGHPQSPPDGNRHIGSAPLRVTEEDPSAFYNPWDDQSAPPGGQQHGPGDQNQEAFNPYAAIKSQELQGGDDPLIYPIRVEEREPAPPGGENPQKQDYPSRDYDYFDPYAQQTERYEPSGGLYNPFNEAGRNTGPDAFYNPYPDERPRDQRNGPRTDAPPDGYLPEEGLVYNDKRDGQGYSEPYSIAGQGDNYADGNIITDIQVLCPPGQNTMVVTLRFNQAFSGRIYAKEYYDVQGCRTRGKGDQMAQIVIGLDSCGFKQSADEYTKDGGKIVYDNVLVVMSEPEWEVLEGWDRAFAVRCQFEGFGQQAVNTGVTAPNLGVTTVATYRIGIPQVLFQIFGGEDISKGPAEHLKVGQKSALAAILTDNSDYDISVTQCVAHDGTGKKYIPLVDEKGCPLVGKKIIGNFRHERDRPQPGQTIVYAPFKAFKFPDRQDVYFECQVHVCFRECFPSECYESYSDGDSYGGDAYGRKRRTLDGKMAAGGGGMRAVNASGNAPYIAERVNMTRGIAVLIDGERRINIYPSDTALKQRGGGSGGDGDGSREEVACISRTGFTIAIAFLTASLLVAILVSVIVCLKTRDYWLKDVFKVEPEAEFGFTPPTRAPSIRSVRSPSHEGVE
ncbi:PREDICTED: uncharacterized protein LOC106812340 [Priapulus caudatus]|uniref:Uncharacterized protein LOC106812340 n=1 Tax=Priapulus caudatus TaxID=37621 RepID=A0ABM1EHK6_PRICU|nr:PREDICTED: uncharacterized protein LOC106812340 [Priapulus caudatus]